MSDPLQRNLDAALDAMPPAPLVVAFSGGADSSALLHALAHLPAARQRGLRALHVDHGLHAASAAWAQHCNRYCDALDVACIVLPAQVQRDSGKGPEAAARDARHAALASALHDGEYLLFAHHRDDQVETVLLKLLRGAGPEGLAGMRALRPFGRGKLWRPLLELSRAQLREYADTHRLDFIEDPSNADTRLGRNQLRHEILPRLAGHWPQAVDSILHSAGLLRAAAEALRRQWLAAYDVLHDPADGSLDARAWQALTPALREPLLDHWLHARGLKAPSASQRRQIERQCGARPGQQPCIRWPGVDLRIWNRRLWALPTRPPAPSGWQRDWLGEPLALPDGGELSLDVVEARLGTPLRVCLRSGGERIRPAGDAHTRELRDLFQQARLPPWQRAACPLLYAGDQLVAVADRWSSAEGVALFDDAGATPRWKPGR
ncbi:MAG: tRNA lysidine(34) synthetase TilS [Rhodanobacter sp.]